MSSFVSSKCDNRMATKQNLTEWDTELILESDSDTNSSENQNISSQHDSDTNINKVMALLTHNMQETNSTHYQPSVPVHHSFKRFHSVYFDPTSLSFINPIKCTKYTQSYISLMLQHLSVL